MKVWVIIDPNDDNKPVVADDGRMFVYTRKGWAASDAKQCGYKLVRGEVKYEKPKS